VLARSWNLFHGNTTPPGKRRYTDEMVRRACVGGPAVVLLQEVPPYALPRLHAWSGYTAVGVVAARPRLRGPLGVSLTDFHSGLVRSAVEGQANAVLVAPDVHVLERQVLTLNPRSFRARLRLPWRARVAWALERRICQAVRVALRDGRTLLVANLHATSYRADKRLADAELLRAATFADALAHPGEPVVLGGDFNVTTQSSPTLRALGTSEWGFSSAGRGLDHVLVRDVGVVAAERHWPDEQRRHGARLLSDHAPVEVEFE